jgi:hypothetical protein
MQMNQHTVFFSHSSVDRKALAELKSLFDNKAAGFVNWFLSSDGQSIKLGTNWVVGISDALGPVNTN